MNDETIRRLQAELDAIWQESQAGNTVIRDAGVMQDIVKRLKAVLGFEFDSFTDDWVPASPGFSLEEEG